MKNQRSKKNNQLMQVSVLSSQKDKTDKEWN